jgi:hypothetical protein
MVKRIAAAPLWFVSIWLTYGLVAYFAGWPSNPGAILGALAAALVFMDPTGFFWGPATSHSAVTAGTLPGRVDRAV